MGPDPYRDWLAIETDHETPNHYELLGLDVFTDDTAVVHRAFEDRYALVRRYESGHYGDRALALMAELSDAFKCLTNEQQKSQYDRELHETLASRETSTDVWAMYDTLVEQMGELEELVESELQVQVPPDEVVPPDEAASPDEAAPTVVDALGSMPAMAAPSYVPVSAEPSGVSLPPARPVSANSRTRELAIPVWLSVLCTFGAGLLVIGAIAVAINVFGSRDQQDSTVQMPLAPPAAGDRADAGEPVAVSADASANKGIEFRGRLARVLIDDGGTLHLLVASSNRLFEARSKDRDLVQQLADFVCLAEDAALADEVKVAGTVADETASFFDPQGRLRPDQREWLVLDLQSLSLADSSSSGETALTEEDQQTQQSLRSIGQFTQFVATVSSPYDSRSRRFQATFHGRDYLVEIPDAWPAVGVRINRGQEITVVTRTTGRYESPSGGVDIADMLLLEVETINQPSFQQFIESASQDVGFKVAYQATARLALLKDNQATLNLELQHAGTNLSIQGLAGVASGQDAFLKKLDGRDPLLAELMVERAGSPATYKVVSLTRLNDAADRVVFDAVVLSEPEPKPLAEESVPKPETILALGDLPDYVDLPALTSRASEPLTPAVDLADLEIELASELIALDATYRFAAKKIAGAQPPRWEVYLQKTVDARTHEVLVAHLAVTDKRLVFRWDDKAGALPAGQLRNCLMRLESPGQSHDIALRSPLRLGATGLPSEEAKFNIPFNLEDVPSTDGLAMEIEVTYDGLKIESETRSDTAPRSKRLDFKVEQLQYVEIHAVLHVQEDKSLVLNATPRIQMIGGRQVILSTKEVDDYEKRIRPPGLKAEKDIEKAQIALEAAIEAYSRARTNAARARANASIVSQRRAIESNEQTLFEMEQALDAVDTLRDYVDAVQSSTLIRYRVYAEAGETRLLLVDGGYGGEQASRTPASGGKPLTNAAGIDGLWQLIRFELGGNRIDRSDAAQLRLEDGFYSCQVGSFMAQGGYQIDASTAPPTITFIDFGQPALRQVGIFMESGVFDLTSNGTELSIAFGTDGSQAKGMAAMASRGGFVSVYRRVK